MAETQSSDRLSFTIFMAIALHAMLIFGITFTLPKSDKVAPTLNITLATHASKREPKDADFLAQSNQEASGTEDQAKELTTTEQAEVADVNVHEVNPVFTPESQQKKQETRKVISTQADAARTAPSQTETQDPQNQSEAETEPTPAQLRSEKLASLQAKLDRERQAMAREPRVTRHTSVSTKSSDEAAYYNYWSDKIVRIGNKNFPKEALEKEIFGSLRMEVSIRANGTVASAKVTSSSGYTLLDDAARRIVKLAQPFRPLPPEITKNADVFVIYRTWNFEITGLSTSE